MSEIDDPRVAVWEDLFRREIAPWAEAVDQGDLFPEQSLRRLAEAGCASVTAGSEVHGPPLRADALWRFHESLASACGTTWFVLVQHLGACSQVAAAESAELSGTWLTELVSGRRWMGVAFGHLRRPEPMVRAIKVSGGWEIDGLAPWVTGWPLLDAIIVGALTADGRHLFAVIETRHTPGCTPSDPLRLSAMQASRTVAVRFDRVSVSESNVLRIADPEELRQGDRSNLLKTIAPLSGVASTALSVGRASLRSRSLSEAGRDWEILSARHADLRTKVLEALTSTPGPSDDDRLALRTEAISLAMDITAGAVVAGAGNGVLSSLPAQRLQREAAFYSVFQQTSAIAGSIVAALARRWK